MELWKNASACGSVGICPRHWMQTIPSTWEVFRVTAPHGGSLAGLHSPPRRLRVGGVTDNTLLWLLSIKRNDTAHNERGWRLVSADKCDALPSVSRADLTFKWSMEGGIERDRDIMRERGFISPWGGERVLSIKLGSRSTLKVWLQSVDMTLRQLSEFHAQSLASSLQASANLPFLIALSVFAVSISSETQLLFVCHSLSL